MNIGYFTSFTVFLAMNDPDFCNKYLRAVPMPTGLLSMSAYLQFWGWFYLCITIVLCLFKKEVNFQSKGALLPDSNLNPGPLSSDLQHGHCQGCMP